MGYEGYLLKINNTIFPLKYIKAETYNVLWSTNDLDSFRDANGDLHRNALSNKKVKIEFNTPPLITNNELELLMNILRTNYISDVEKSVNVTFFNSETNSYITQKCYVPDITFTMYGIFDNVIKYNPVRFAFIGY